MEGFPDAEAYGMFLTLKADNQEKFKKIMAEGISPFNPLQLMSIQIDVLLSLLSPEFRASWAVEFETRMQDALDETIENLPRIKLQAGVTSQAPGQLILP